MTHQLDVILTLTFGLGSALALGIGARALRLSPVVGYLLAGLLVGPFTPGFVAHGAIAGQFAEIGVILLMFGVGLEFHVEQVLSVRRVVVPSAIAQVAISTLVGALVGHWAGFGLAGSLIFGLCLALASTVVALRTLGERGALPTAAGHTAVGYLVVGDLLAVLVLVFLPMFAGGNDGHVPSVEEKLVTVVLALAKLAALVVFTLVAGRKLIPRLLGFVARLRSRELFTLSVLALALGIAVGSSLLFGASMALGAFLAGLVVGRSEFSARAASEALPMRDSFAVLFFVSTGMLLDPRQVLPQLPIVVAGVLVVLVVTPVAILVSGRLFGGAPRAIAISAGALAQIGEFSFILATLGIELGLLPPRAGQVVVCVSLVTIIASPFATTLYERFGQHAAGVTGATGATGAKQSLSLESIASSDISGNRVIVIGHGPVGRTLVGLLRDNGLEPFVIDLNHLTVRRLLGEGTHALHGDATQREILVRAGIEHAVGLVFAASGPSDAVIRVAKELRPRLPVLARTTYLSELEAVTAAGADIVVAAEGEVAMAMAEHLLVRFGATPDQLDRARERVRAELTGKPAGRRIGDESGPMATQGAG